MLIGHQLWDVAVFVSEAHQTTMVTGYGSLAVCWTFLAGPWPPAVGARRCNWGCVVVPHALRRGLDQMGYIYGMGLLVAHRSMVRPESVISHRW